ncbi:MAG: mechanosensitive ion channel family protein, partial [Deefgea sp.]
MLDAALITKYQDIVVGYIAKFGVTILAGIAFWVIGRWLIGLVVRFVQAGLTKQKVDPTVLRYVGSAVTVLLN